MISAPESPSIAAWWIFGEHRHRSVLEPVDQVQLPQRPGAVERAGEDPRDLLGELLVGPGRRQGELADVEVEVEVAVVDPVGVVEPERHLGEAPAHRRQQRQPLGDHLLHVGELELAARRRASDRGSRPRPRARSGARSRARGTGRRGWSAAAYAESFMPRRRATAPAHASGARPVSRHGDRASATASRSTPRRCSASSPPGGARRRGGRATALYRRSLRLAGGPATIELRADGVAPSAPRPARARSSRGGGGRASAVRPRCRPGPRSPTRSAPTR